VKLKLTVVSETSGPKPIRTATLPDGVPEEDMKDAHEHKIGHLGSLKKNINS